MIKELVIKGHITLKYHTDEFDLVAHGIVHIKDYSADRIQYTSLEPLMYWAMFKYLDYNGVKFEDLLIDWMRQIVTDLKTNEKYLKKYADSEKGFATEVLLAHMMVWIAKDLHGKPITDHELFAELKGTYLDDYTIEYQTFQHDSNGLWKEILQGQRTDIVIIPPQKMRPDVFGLLKCIKGTPSYEQYGNHTIPLTAGCKMYNKALSKVYLDNISSTDLRQSFTIDGRTVKNAEKERNDAIQLIDQVFGKNNERSLRILFLYNPFKGKRKQKKFDEKIEVLLPKGSFRILHKNVFKKKTRFSPC